MLPPCTLYEMLVITNKIQKVLSAWPPGLVEKSEQRLELFRAKVPEEQVVGLQNGRIQLCQQPQSSFSDAGQYHPPIFGFAATGYQTAFLQPG